MRIIGFSIEKERYNMSRKDLILFVTMWIIMWSLLEMLMIGIFMMIGLWPVLIITVPGMIVLKVYVVIDLFDTYKRELKEAL